MLRRLAEWYMGRIAGRYCPCEWPVKVRWLIRLCGRIDDVFVRASFIRLGVLVAALALVVAAPALAQYADDSGGGQPICNENVAGYWYGGEQCVHDPFGDNWTWM